MFIIKDPSRICIFCYLNQDRSGWLRALYLQSLCVWQSRWTLWVSYLRLRSGCIIWWRTALDVPRRAPPPAPPYAPPCHCWRTLLTRSSASRPPRPSSLPPLTIGKCWSGSQTYSPPHAIPYAPPHQYWRITSYKTNNRDVKLTYEPQTLNISALFDAFQGTSKIH